VFKDSKTKPKYSIRKYSIGAASALIGFMTLVHGQVAHADEAQSISDLTNASNQSQAPQTASTAQLATSEPTSEIVQTSQPVNVMPFQPQVTTVQAAEQTSTIDQMVETGTSQNQETSANVLTNATEDQGQGKKYNTDNYGAKMPYTSHEAENATIENGATIQQSTDMESTAVEATNQTYVELLKKDAAVTFNVTEPSNALNVRYTIPDGASGQLDVQVNGSSVGNLDLSSHSAWQYLKGDQEYDQAIDGSSARFRFDETRLLLKDIQLTAGDKISLVKKKDDTVPYGIDFIELEQAPAPVAQGENSINIVDKGASANDDSDDTAALLAAVEEAKASGKSVYIPEGRFNFDKQVNIEADNLKISGAGVWHTQLHFTSDKRYGGGIVFGHNSNGIELSNLYMDSNLTSRYKEDAQYKAISGTLGKDSHIHDVWVQHFEVGMWIGDYDQTGNMKYTDGLIVENTRIRNNLADGINFAQGTKNSTVKNSNIRGNGDDGLAIWSSISDGTNAAAEENNKFLNNTIESGWRAAGIGIFGGKGHEISGNLIKDVFAGAGIRVNTVFAGHNFDHNDTGIKIHDNTIIRSGTTNDLYNLHRGAIDFQQVRGTIKNVDVYDNKLLNTLADPVITKNFEMGDRGNGEIRLSNNTIDNKATVIEAVSAVSPTKPVSTPVNNPVSETSVSEASNSEVVSKTSASESPKSESSSTAPFSEVSTSEVVSETSSSETPKSEVSSTAPVSETSTSEANSTAPVSETSNSEFISESSSSETPKSEASSTAPVSEASTNEVISETSVSETPKSEANSTAPVSETSNSEVISETSASETLMSEEGSSAPFSEASNSEVISETSVSESPKSEEGSSAPVSEASNSEVISETSVSEAPISEVVSETSNSKVISETSVSETPKSEVSSTTPASESPKSDEASGASSTSQVDVAITSDSPEKTSTSESTQKDPIREVSSEVIEKGSTSQIAVKVSEAPTTARTSEVVSILPNSQMAYNDDLKTPVTSSQLTSVAIPYHSLLNAKSVDMIASKVMAVMASETLASEAATLASSEGAIKEISNDLSELAENKKDDKPENVARIDKKTEARQVAKASGSQESTSKEKSKLNTATVLFLVGIGAALSLSTVYLTKHGKNVSK
jgi:hypothetical protein